MIAQTSESTSADSDVDLNVEVEQEVTEEERGDCEVLVAEDEESVPPRPLFGAWGASLWSSLQETAADFTASLAAENEQTIEVVKENLQQEKLEENVGKVGEYLTGSLTKVMDVVSETATSAMAASFVESGTSEDTSGVPSEDQDCPSVDPKPFEKERATYAMDPLRSSKHSSKFKLFCESELSKMSDSELIKNGRSLMRGNRAISTYFNALVPADISEKVFWQRYYYWRDRYEKRERMLSMMSPSNPSKQSSAISATDESGSVTDQESDVSSAMGAADPSSTPPAPSDTLVSQTVSLDKTVKSKTMDKIDSEVPTVAEEETGGSSTGVESSMDEVKSSSEPESWNDITLSQVESSGAESAPTIIKQESLPESDVTQGETIAKQDDDDDDNWGDWE